MALPLNLNSSIVGYQLDSCDDRCTIEATAVTGCEAAAKIEIAEKFGVPAEEITKCQGRIVFDIPIEKAPQLVKLRCVDNLYVLIFVQPEFFPEKKQDDKMTTEENLSRLVENIQNLNWDKGLKVWKLVSGFSDEDLPSFRCTCYRSGENHNFTSTEVAQKVGGAIQDKFQWKVQMKNMDIEVVFNIDIKQVYSGISLNKVSLYKRTVHHFGPTTLRATICSSLLRYADVVPGDVVVDPMCGGGSIPLEGALEFNRSFHLAGEMHELAIQRTRNNIRDLKKESGKETNGLGNIDAIRWDAIRIPLRDNSVDVFVSDLPFGKRSGSKADNRVLYPRTLISMARVVRPSTGRAVVLTQDKNSMFKSMPQIKPYWKIVKNIGANIGGLAALIFIFKRTEKEVEAKDLAFKVKKKQHSDEPFKKPAE